jgi:5-(carboxyamino)imidazole ribonucleotide mutase
MGSDSDWSVMEDAAQALAEFDVPFEVGVVSAHRTPARMLDYAGSAAGRGIEVIIAGAGGAAHLPGMVASATPLPVIGVPVPLAKLDGLDSLLSIVQMPAGVPVATVSIGGARNAGLLAVRILGASDAALRTRMTEFQSKLAEMVLQKDAALRNPRGEDRRSVRLPASSKESPWPSVTRRSMLSSPPTSTTNCVQCCVTCARRRSPRTRPMSTRRPGIPTRRWRR